MDIGKVQSPQKSSSSKMADKLVLQMSDLTKFISKVEDIVDTELETLRSYIQKNSSERARTLNLTQFYDHVYLWGENIWFERNGGAIKEDPLVEADNTYDVPSYNSPGKTFGAKKTSIGIG